ncbi:biotin--[acetyl-CoA-carboxylase] ligase [Aciduricibacillus chroicocephali]|uniref:Bifunctional ligase/repressor BirA n=1 Tax=Aciduricibacillus chroicocephali TaxID=3054939 RepID=A0ABY9KYR4_9BACI|nr:biotin--[acetyl-CoA-carboxylase] ligase [Bacillaceae bacterium 44XB]
MESNRNRLIALLEENKDQYISGQKLSEQLNISRSAIWKHMKELEKDGYEIEGKSRKGYRIISFPDKLSENTLQWGLKTKWLGKTIIHRESIDSTQFLAHQTARDGAAHGTVIIADEQTKGKGRMNREWHSAPGKGIWLSMILRPQLLPYLAAQLTLLAATVLADVVNEHIGVRPQIKWPNDILINGKKTAGILTEMQAEQDQIQYVVIGMGINVNQAEVELPENISYKATSIRAESGKEWDIKELIQQILQTFEHAYESYIENGFPEVKEKWESYGFKIGEMIDIKTMQDEWRSEFLGIAEDGALLATDREGHETKLYSAEIKWFEDGNENAEDK